MSTLGTAGASHIATPVDNDVELSFSGIWAGHQSTRLTTSGRTLMLASAWSSTDTAIEGDCLFVQPIRFHRGQKLSDGSWFQPTVRLALTKQATSKSPWQYVETIRDITFSFDYDTTPNWFSGVFLARHTSASSNTIVRVDSAGSYHGEPSVAINPTNPDEIVAAGHSAFGCGAYRSADGGSTWTESGEISGSTIGGLFDPVVAADSQGNFYYTCAQFFYAITGLPGHLYVFKSTDGGESWIPRVASHASSGILVDFAIPHDKPWIAVDNFPDSPNHGNVYLTVMEDDLLAITSTDQGETWTRVGLGTYGAHSHPFQLPTAMSTSPFWGATFRAPSASSWPRRPTAG